MPVRTRSFSIGREDKEGRELVKGKMGCTFEITDPIRVKVSYYRLWSSIVINHSTTAYTSFLPGRNSGNNSGYVPIHPAINRQ